MSAQSNFGRFRAASDLGFPGGASEASEAVESTSLSARAHRLRHLDTRFILEEFSGWKRASFEAPIGLGLLSSAMNIRFPIGLTSSDCTHTDFVMFSWDIIRVGDLISDVWGWWLGQVAVAGGCGW